MYSDRIKPVHWGAPGEVWKWDDCVCTYVNISGPSPPFSRSHCAGTRSCQVIWECPVSSNPWSQMYLHWYSAPCPYQIRRVCEEENSNLNRFSQAWAWSEKLEFAVPLVGCCSYEQLTTEYDYSIYVLNKYTISVTMYFVHLYWNSIGLIT